MEAIAKSLSFDQPEILKWIMRLNDIERFDADITYGNGSFYKEVPEPLMKFDIDPQVDGVQQASSDNLPLDDGALGSVVFDPPFLTYVRAARAGNGNMVMAKRFSGYWRYDELADHYQATLRECHRVLKRNGIMVFKCQDIIHNHRMHCTHVNVLRWADGMFALKDLFVLGAKNRMPAPNRKGKQKHARIFHSYFLVLRKT